MRSFLSVVNGVFDLIFLPFRSMDPIYALSAVSVLTGILMIIVYRYTSDQTGIKRIKERIKAHFLEIRLFQDQLEVVLQAHARILRCTLTYMGYSLKPLAVIILPVVLIMVQLEMRLGQRPARPEEPFLVKAKLTEPSWLEQTSLQLPPGLALAAPPLRIPERKEINWRVAARERANFELGVMVGERTFSKQVTVTDRVVPLSTRRVRNNLLEEFLYPGEAPLPQEGPLESIEVKYRPRCIDLGFVQAHWLVPFFVLALVSGLALKGFWRTEI